jgi:hypothetical protein
MAIIKNLVDRRGGWIYYGERKWQGQESLVNSLREEPDFFDELREKVLNTPDSFVGASEDE